MNNSYWNKRDACLPKGHNIHWDAAKFFEQLTHKNRLAQYLSFRFCRVSGLTGFEEAVAAMQDTTAFVCFSDISQGVSKMNENTPNMQKVKTVFFAMRHPVDDMKARDRCMQIMHELFRQFMTILIQEKTRLQQNFIYIDENISFQEIDQYFFSGCAGAYFQISVKKFIDLRYNPEEWIEAEQK